MRYISTTGKRRSCHKENLTLTLTLTPTLIQVATHTPRFWMDFDFDRVRLALSDGQLKLVCGMIRENFMERAVHGLLPPLKQEGFDRKDDVMD